MGAVLDFYGPCAGAVLGEGVGDVVLGLVSNRGLVGGGGCGSINEQCSCVGVVAVYDGCVDKVYGEACLGACVCGAVKRHRNNLLRRLS